MKKSLFVALSMLCLGGSAYAIPFASYVKLGTTDVKYDTGTVISYVLNETADSVLIEVLNNSNSVVASFEGTSTVGDNTVNWNGKNDNKNTENSTPVAVGSYKFRVTANKNVAGTAWRTIASVRTDMPAPAGAVLAPNFITSDQTAPNLFNGIGPTFTYTLNNQTLDDYGTYLVQMSVASPSKMAAAMQLRGDLVLRDVADRTASKGYDSRTLKATVFESGTVASGSLWGGSLDPTDPQAVFVTGQDGAFANQFLYGKVNTDGSSANLTENMYEDNVASPAFLPRGLTITVEDGVRKVYFISGNDLYKASINASNKIDSAIGKISTLPNYARSITSDVNGNVYLLTRGTAAANPGGLVLRWNAATVKAAVGATALTAANAEWNVTIPTTMINMQGLTITPDGNVFTIAAHTGGVTTLSNEAGLYLVGNISSATSPAALTSAANRVVNFRTLTDNKAWALGNTYSSVNSDPVGNLIVVDRTNEQIRVFSAPGNTSKTTNAPSSQAFTINYNAKVEDWKVY